MIPCPRCVGVRKWERYTEVEGISFEGYTGVEGGRPRLWNLQNLCPVPPYAALMGGFAKSPCGRAEGARG